MNKFLLFGGGALGVSSYFFYKTYGNGNNHNHNQQPDFAKIKKEINDSLWNYDYVDHNYGPLLVRLAWHTSGTYDKKTNTGGSNGATMRYKLEANDKDNAGLEHARNLLEKIKKNNPAISYSDLWIYAAYVAIETMGGPKIEFCSGRVDALSEKDCPPNGRLPDAEKNRSHIRDVFYRMGFNDQEIVALIGGGHSLGGCHPHRSGYENNWTFTPITFSNTFFKELFGRTWEKRKWDGKPQFEDNESKRLMMLPTDMELRDDPEFGKWSKIYHDDEKRFVEDFAKTFKKLTELGCNNLKKI